jgi:hypothetical protein
MVLLTINIFVVFQWCAFTACWWSIVYRHVDAWVDAVVFVLFIVLFANSILFATHVRFVIVILH